MRSSTKTTRKTIAIPKEWVAEIERYVAGNDASVFNFSDYVNKAIAESLNKMERSRGLTGTHIYQSADARRGRPVGSKNKPKVEQSHVSNSNEEAEVVETVNAGSAA